MKRKAYRVSEVAKILGIGRTTIYQLIAAGDLQRVKVGASTLIPAQDVDALLQRNAV